jgi:hypothetical protein
MPGTTLRGDRLLRYVSAFCPHCHHEDPERPLAEVRRLGAAGFHAYWRSWRAGLRRSDCVLRDPRLVMLYLGLVSAAGVAWTVLRALRFFGGA